MADDALTGSVSSDPSGFAIYVARVLREDLAVPRRPTGPPASTLAGSHPLLSRELRECDGVTGNHRLALRHRSRCSRGGFPRADEPTTVSGHRCGTAGPTEVAAGVLRHTPPIDRSARRMSAIGPAEPGWSGLLTRTRATPRQQLGRNRGWSKYVHTPPEPSGISSHSRTITAADRRAILRV
jgi:hypothetical protein